MTTFTDRWYEELPGFLPAADGAGTLRGFLALGGDRVDVLRALLERLDTRLGTYTHPSDLTDADAADEAWLGWLAGAVGVAVLPSDATAVRESIRLAPGGYRAGTKQAVADAARSALTGTKFVSVYTHSIVTPGDGTWLDLLLVTRASETADPAAVYDAVVSKQAKPAGIHLRVRSFTATWTAVEAAYPTWSAVDGRSWSTIEETGL